MKPLCNARCRMALILPSMILCCFALPLVAAEPAATYDLKPKRIVGDTSDFERFSEFRRQFFPEGREQPSVDVIWRTRDTGRVTTASVKDGVPVAVKIAFDVDGTMTTERPGERPIQRPSILAGRTVTASADEKGRVQHDYRGDARDELIQQQLKSFVCDDAYMNAGKSVAVGDTWPADKPRLRRFYDLPEDGECDGECRLIAVKEIDGRKAAEVSIVVHVTKTFPDNPPSRFVADGVILYDLATGQRLRISLRGTITSTIQQANPPDPNRVPGREVVKADWLMRSTPATQPARP